MTAVDPAQLVRELTELRRERGLDAADVHSRVGPLLRQVCAITESDAPVIVRRKLVLRISALLGRLPADLQLAATVALALHEEATGQFLDRRVAWLAVHFDRDPRTARRRIDQAFQLLSQHLSEGQSSDPRASWNSSENWRVLELRVVLRLDVDPPTLTEERRIVAAVDELDELLLALSAPRSKDSPDAERIEAKVMYGGEIVERQDVSESHACFVLRLPRPLRLGQKHEYGVQFTSYSRAAMRPYYVLTPLRPCEYFLLRVRFDRAALPRQVWRLGGLPARVVDDAVPTDELLSIDPVGDLALEFHDLRQGLSYGLQWLP